MARADFTDTTFESTADFSYATFLQHTSFKEIAVLEGAKLHFDRIHTENYLGIIPKVLEGIVTIEDPTLYSEHHSLVVDFKKCEPHNTGTVLFENVNYDNDRVAIKILNLKEDSNINVNFKDCGFYGKNVAFTKVAMKQISITGGNNVLGMAFYNCYWDSMMPELWFNRCGWLNFRAFEGIKAEHERELIESYGYLKNRVLEAGDAQLSNDFHFWHQFYQRQKKFWNPFYLCTSAYGLSMGLPLFIFTSSFFLFSLAYMWNLHSFTESNFVSLSASVPFVFNDVEVIKQKVELIATQENWWFYPLYILQHLMQGYLLFQIGAAIRNKVKR